VFNLLKKREKDCIGLLIIFLMRKILIIVIKMGKKMFIILIKTILFSMANRKRTPLQCSRVLSVEKNIFIKVKHKKTLLTFKTI